MLVSWFAPGSRIRRQDGSAMVLNLHRRIRQDGAAALTVGLAMSAAATVGAQQVAQSFSELGTHLRVGDSVILTDSAGQKVRGKIATLSPASVELIVPDPRIAAETQRIFRDADVQAVALRRPDPLKDGVLKGLGFGALAGAVVGAVALEHQLGEGAGATGALGGAMVGGLWGSVIGLAGDASVQTTTVIYAKPAGSAGRLRLSPLLGRDRNGVSMAVAF